MNEEIKKLSEGEHPMQIAPTKSVPLLSAEEFLTTTPAHELTPLFGGNPTPVKPPETFGVPRGVFPPLTQKNPGPKVSVVADVPIEKQKTSLARIIVALFLIILIVFVSLYIWGGILKRTGYSETAVTEL